MNAPAFALRQIMTKVELAGVIDSAGAPGLLSPRSLLGAPAKFRAAATGALRDAAHVLRDPHTRITLRIWGGEEASAETTVLFPAAPAAGGGYLLNDVAGGFEVSGPVDAEQILALVAPLVPPSAAGAPFVGQFEPATMAVLAALTDIAREDIRQDRIVRALDGRAVPDSLLVSVVPLAMLQLTTYLDGWWVLSRFDQLLTYAVALGGEPRPPQPPAVAAALSQLSSVGLIAIDDSQNITLTAAATPLLEAVFGLSAGFQWQRVSRLNDGNLSINERIVLLCAGGLILSLSVTAAGLLRLACPSRDEIAAFLASELSGMADCPAPPEGAAPKAAQARRFCEHCGHAVGAADRFCGECGRELT